MRYSNAEKADMILIFGECSKNAVQAKTLYAERYPDRQHPSCKTFSNLFKKLKETGSLENKKHKRTKTATGEGNEVAVLAGVSVNPEMSSREIATQSGISQSSVIRILHRHKFHPYRISLHQELHGNDFQNRIDFCDWVLHQNTIAFYSNILFSDESTFNNRGNVNRWNMHYWSAENPHWLRQVEHQRQWSVNVWCGIINNRVIGPYFINGTLTAQKYTNFLRNILPVLLEEVPLQVRQGMWFQQDGCPAHYARLSREQLNKSFHNKWIGRGGTVNWPARSPDLNPLDYFLWGTLKNLVFKNVPTTVEDMQQRIIDACQAISSETIIAATQSFIHRARICRDANGSHFEHLLK